MNSQSINSLVLSARRYANQVNTATFTDDELRDYVYASAAQLYEITVAAYNDYYTERYYLDLVARQESYELPNDFRSLNAVYSLQTGPGTRWMLKPYTATEYARYSINFVNPQWPFMYRLRSNRLFLLPVPAVNRVRGLEVWYTPQFKRPAGGDDVSFDPVLPNGFEEWIALDVAIKMATKMRLPDLQGMLMDLKKPVEKRVIGGLAIRSSDPPRMIDIADNNFWFPWNGGTSGGTP